MSKHMKSTPHQRQEITGMERLSLRVSAMINHPLAQTQRWVTVHRLDTDGDAEWEEVMGLLADLVAANRKLIEAGLVRLRQIEDGLAVMQTEDVGKRRRPTQKEAA